MVEQLVGGDAQQRLHPAGLERDGKEQQAGRHLEVEKGGGVAAEREAAVEAVVGVEHGGGVGQVEHQLHEAVGHHALDGRLGLGRVRFEAPVLLDVGGQRGRWLCLVEGHGLLVWGKVSQKKGRYGGRLPRRWDFDFTISFCFERSLGHK